MVYVPDRSERDDYLIAKLFVGHILDKRFEVAEVVGIGGMGYVYRGRDTRLQRDVAIKILRKEYCERGELIQRFANEAFAITRVKNHPNIVEVYDRGEYIMNGIRWFYLVMEYLTGPTLEDIIDEHGALPAKEAYAYISQVLLGLNAAHAVGVVHRDLKPGNMKIVDPAGQPPRLKILDFGISRLLGIDGIEDSKLTRAGVVFGSPYYMSPEQARGDIEAMGARSDIYSAGIIMFQFVAGTLPFDADLPFAKIMTMHLEVAPPKPSSIRSDISPELDAVILKALAKRPEDRWQSAEEFRRALRLAIFGEQEHEPRTTIPPRVELANGNQISPAEERLNLEKTKPSGVMPLPEPPTGVFSVPEPPVPAPKLIITEGGSVRAMKPERTRGLWYAAGFVAMIVLAGAALLVVRNMGKQMADPKPPTEEAPLPELVPEIAPPPPPVEVIPEKAAPAPAPAVKTGLSPLDKVVWNGIKPQLSKGAAGCRKALPSLRKLAADNPNFSEAQEALRKCNALVGK